MTLSTPAVAVCCCRASCNSRLSRVTSVSSRGAATAAQGLRCIAARQRLAVVRFSRFATRFITPSHRRPLAQDTASYRLAPTDAYKIAVKDCTTSALGHKRTFAAQKGMSALPPKADMCGATRSCPLSANSGHRAFSTFQTNTARRGRIILISVNSPGCVSTSIEPPCCLTMMS